MQMMSLYFFMLYIFNFLLNHIYLTALFSLLLNTSGQERRWGFYLSISGITKSSVPIMATKSPSLLPLAM